MMDLIDLAITNRIRNSPLKITLVYPAALPVAVGVAPGPAPVSPLTGPATSNEVINEDADPTSRNVTMCCLWLDIATGLGDSTGAEATQFQQVGWVAEATALARVLVCDAALDSKNPYGGTKFDEVSYVLYYGKRFRVLQTTLISAGHKLPVSYYVWLIGEK